MLQAVRRRRGPPATGGLGGARHLAQAGVRGARELDRREEARSGPPRVSDAEDGACVHFAGDSGWCPHFAEVGARFPRLDLALPPVGACRPRWFVRTRRVDPEGAVRAHLMPGARRGVGMHFGTFAGLTDGATDAPEAALAAAREKHGVPPEGAFGTPPFGAALEAAAGSGGG